MDWLSEFLGESPAVGAVRDQVRKFLGRQLNTGRHAPSILIQGETGTGKGLVAKLLHRGGPRAQAPFVDLNCAAIPEALLEAELFGFERGAFTDARRAKPGLFQAANHGTIFLDEIGLLPEGLQSKLLKVIEERAVRRLGGTTSEAVDVWIISATNTDLRIAISERRFREDLYHRLAVLTLYLPPLRERGRDVLLLAERFLARACADYGLPPKTLSPEAQDRLLAYPWPGNVRELGNMIERVALLVEGPIVSADSLELPAATVARAAAPAPASAPASLDEALREHLLAALTQTGWNISRTAALLRISRNTLRARIEKFGLRVGASAPAPGLRPARVPAAAPAVAELQLPAYAPAAPTPAPAVAAPSAIRWETRRLTLLQATLIAPEGDDEAPDTSRALAVLLDKLRAFGARIEEFSPRGVGAVFGLEPVEDAPRRAAHAAMAIQKAAERGRRGDGESFSVKVGIHVGEVLVGQSSAGIAIDADAKRAQWDALDALRASAEPDSIMLTSAAAPFLERHFNLAGESSAVGRAYRLQGRERKWLALEGGMAWFVGRRQELDVLKSRLASARAGRGQIVGIVGEVGIGKSRLLYEFRQALRGEAITYVEGHCLSYGSTIPYLPALEILRHACRITDADAPEAVTHKLRMNLQYLGLNPEDSLPYLLQFLGIKVGTEALAAWAPEAIRHRTFQILRQMCANASRQRPLVIAVEDMHWIDAASEALGAMLESLERIPLLLVLTYRPGYRLPWLAKSHMTQIALQPLSGEESLNVLGGLLPLARLSEPVAQLILSKAEGNPFFLEELARSVREQSGLSPAVTVPDTVQEVLLARMNRLPERERQLLQSAAVIGRNVSLEVLRPIADLADDALSEALGQLCAADFLYEANFGPAVQYSFKHALSHEVTYGSLLDDRQRTLHAKIVHAIEVLYPDRLIEQVERLAHHAFRSERWRQALTYLRQAGAKAAMQAANREAVGYFDQALVALGHLPESPEQIAYAIDLRFDVRTALLPLGEFARILQHLRAAEELAQRLEDQERLGRVCAFLTDYFRQVGEYQTAIETGQRGLAIVEKLQDLSLKIATNIYLGHAFHDLGDYGRASEFFRENVQSIPGTLTHERLGLPYVASVHSRTWLVLCLAEVGQFEEGKRLAGEALEIAELVADPVTVISACYGLGRVYLRRGDLEKAIPILERGLHLTNTWNIRLWSAVLAEDLGTAHAQAGRIADAMPLLEESVQRHGAMRGTAGQSRRMTSLCEGYLQSGRIEEATSLAVRALDLARRHAERGNEAWAVAFQAKLAARTGSLEMGRAETLYQEAMALAEGLRMRPLLAHCHVGLGRLYRAVGNRAAAVRELGTAVTLFTELGMPRYTDQAQANLANLG